MGEKEIRAEVAEFERGAGDPYPAPLRQRVIEFARRCRAEGASWGSIAHRVNVNVKTLHAWCASAAPTGKKLRRVRVTPDAAPSAGSISVISKAGHRATGLTFEQAAALLRALE